MSVSQSSSLMPLHSTHDFQPCWGNLCAPPFHFGRRPPQSNYPPDAVPAPDHGSGLEAQNTKGGIPRLAPRGLASPLHSLPPILDNESRTPTSSCSKGSRGLSVQPRVFGIFTETTISPDPSLRQRPSRYSIRAGRNLPDKEFRSSLTQVFTARIALPFHMQSLHVAVQRGPSLHPVSWMSGVWPLRILIRSCLGFLWFIVWRISTISAIPAGVRCRPVSMIATHRANFS